MKNKIFKTGFLASLSLSLIACGSSSNTKQGSSKKPSDEFLIETNPNKMAYATQTSKSRNSYDSNVIAKVLEDNALRYNYKMPEWPKFESHEGREILSGPSAYGNFYGISKINEEKKYKASEIVAKIIKRWKDLKINLGFIESNPNSNQDTINDDTLYQAIKNELYNDDSEKELKNKLQLVLMGPNTETTYQGKKTNNVWSKFKNMATFEFSEILTAYNTGYQTQANFGLKISEKSGKLVKEKLEVGYVIGALKKETREDNIRNVKKANAFRQGVLDAVKEQNTGPASFVSKNDVSENEDEKKLFWGAGDMKRFASMVRSHKNYKSKDHSIFYMAGASARDNSAIADTLILSGVTNLYGHKMVIEKAFDDEGVFEGLGKENGTNLRAGSGNNFHVRGRIRMNGRHYSEQYELDSSWIEAENSMKGLVTEAIIESLYGINKGKVDFFGKHTQMGTLGVIDPTSLKGGRSHPDSQKLNKKFQKEIKWQLLSRTKKESDFDDQFLGSGY